MNRSGSVIPELLNKYNIPVENMILVCDNLDLFPGVIRLKLKGGDAGHNGIKSVISSVETAEFKRMYIGVGRPANGSEIIQHVLGVPGEEDFEKIKSATDIASDSMLKLAESPVEKVMNEINRIKNRSDITSN
jgi:peptidyl-tRNA hydrolase, PTH1 family